MTNKGEYDSQSSNEYSIIIVEKTKMGESYEEKEDCDASGCSQSMGAAIPVAAEELTADTGQETAETEESVQENGGSEITGETASVSDL